MTIEQATDKANIGKRGVLSMNGGARLFNATLKAPYTDADKCYFVQVDNSDVWWAIKEPGRFKL